MTQAPVDIFVVTESGAEVGYGHVVRLTALLDAMRVHATVFCGGDAAQFFPHHVTCPIEDVEMAVRAHDRSILIVDHPRPQPWLSFADRSHAVLVVIDDVGGPGIRANVVVNGSGFPGYHDYPSLADGAIVRAGFPYVLLRPEFQDLPFPDGPRKGLAIVAGSSSAVQDWVRELLNVGFPSTWEPVLLVVSHAFSSRRLLEARRTGIDVRQGLPASELISALRHKRLSVMTAGMALFEAFALGVPVAAYPAQPSMAEECRHYHGEGLLIDLGDAARCPKTLHDMVDAILNLSSLSDMARACRARVDGRGALRVASLLNDIGSVWDRTGDKAHALSEAARRQDAFPN